MFGNSFGWGIAVVLLALLLGAMTLINSAVTGISDTTPWLSNSGVMGSWDLPIPPESIVPAPTQPGDAGPLYRQAVELYRSLPKADLTDPQYRPVVDAVLSAAPLSSMNLFASKPEELCNYERDREPLTSLINVANTVVFASAISARDKGNQAEAQKCIEAIFLMGYKLYKERLSYQEYSNGLGLMGGAALSMARLAETKGDTARAAQLKAFDAARMQFVMNKAQPVYEVINTIDANKTDWYFGDVCEVAKNAREPMWRVEALLKLGRAKFEANAANQRGAKQLVDQIAADPSATPAIRTTANFASTLTVEQFRILR